VDEELPYVVPTVWHGSGVKTSAQPTRSHYTSP